MTVVLFWLPILAQALEPSEIVVVANSSVSGSVDLARYYMEKRGIPRDHLVRIRTTNKEFCSRDTYNNEIATPIRDFLKERVNQASIRCLVTMYGVPLRINPHAWTKQGKRELEDLQEERAAIQKRLDELKPEASSESVELKPRLAALDKNIEDLNKKDDRAAVDSELSLLLRESYLVKSWVPNPYFQGFQLQSLPVPKKDVLFVARLDASTPKIVRRMIDDGLAVEAAGLKGTAYIDARWPKVEKAKPNAKTNAYQLYDNSLHKAAEKIAALSKMPLVVNDKQELFQKGEAPDAALYSGWYSVNHYVDAFDWKQGAVGYHIASGECVTLRQGTSEAWCKMMLEDGVAATVGPVGEPYLQAFPPPELFFGLLLDGYYSLVEVYFLSVPYLSWQMILVGDPLYRPFKNQ